MTNEAWFAESIRTSEDQIILEVLPVDVSSAYCKPEILRRIEPRALRALLDAAGPSDHRWEDLPEKEALLSQKYYDNESCISGGGGGVVTLANLPDSAALFHCCGGSLTITNLGGRFEELITRHRELLQRDPLYRRDYSRITRPFERRTKQLSSPLDLPSALECDAITNEWREALASNIDGRPSILERLESAGTTSRVTSENRR